MTSYHVICHVTAVTCLFIVNKKKRNIKLRKIDKRKRKMLVSKHTITVEFAINNINKKEKVEKATEFVERMKNV